MPDNLNTVNSTIPLYIVICTLARSGNFLNKYKSSLAMRYLTPLINSVFYYNFQLFLHEMKVFVQSYTNAKNGKNVLFVTFWTELPPYFLTFRISVKFQIFVQSWRREANVLPWEAVQTSTFFISFLIFLRTCELFFSSSNVHFVQCTCTQQCSLC